MPPTGALKALLGSHYPLRDLQDDSSVPELLQAMHSTVQFMLQYRFDATWYHTAEPYLFCTRGNRQFFNPFKKANMCLPGLSS